MNNKKHLQIIHYIHLGNAEATDRAAGYSERYARGNAYKLVANSSIRAYIEERNKLNS
ncbi:terminase small subunit [Ectobacillus panaciterrae]|uniref:terminase small subunit n=1 Tax=Ectobacillus panaciterrae TaxID=363872 RepID=UPI0004034492